MKIYTVEEASQITRVPEIEIIDGVRLGAVKTTVGSAAEPAFPVPYTEEVVRHRSCIHIASDELHQIHIDLINRYDLLTLLEGAMDDADALVRAQEALVAWYGAALDDPLDRQAAGAIATLKPIARYLRVKKDGPVPAISGKAAA